MRVRVENNAQAKRARSLRWRGIALDYFDGHKWQNPQMKLVVCREANAAFSIRYCRKHPRHNDANLLRRTARSARSFAAPHAVAVQIAAPSVYRDAENALYTRAHDSERISYTAYSDTAQPDAEILSADSVAYTKV
jgi:hypothetical protein